MRPLEIIEEAPIEVAQHRHTVRYRLTQRTHLARHGLDGVAGQQGAVGRQGQGGQLGPFALKTRHAERGELLGLWTIEKLDRTRTLFFQDGTARRIEFTLALARVDDDDVDQLGDLELEEELHIDP